MFFFTLPTLESKFLPTTPGRKRGPSISRSIFASCIWDTPPRPKDAVVTSAKTRKSCLLIVSCNEGRTTLYKLVKENRNEIVRCFLFLWLHRCTHAHSQCSSQDQDMYSKGFRFIFTFYCRGGHPHIDTYLPHNSVNTSGIGSSLISSASNLKIQCSRFSFSSFIVEKPSFIGHLKLHHQKRCIVKNADLQFLSSYTQNGLQWVPGISLYQSGGTWYDLKISCHGNSLKL